MAASASAAPGPAAWGSLTVRDPTLLCCPCFRNYTNTLVKLALVVVLALETNMCPFPLQYTTTTFLIKLVLLSMKINLQVSPLVALSISRALTVGKFNFDFTPGYPSSVLILTAQIFLWVLSNLFN